MSVDLTTMTTEEKAALLKSLKADMSPKVQPDDPRILDVVTAIREIATERKSSISEVVAAVLTKMRKRSIVTPALAAALDAEPEAPTPKKK